MALTWYLCDLKTGNTINEFPLSVGDVERRVGAASTVSADLAVHDPRCPAAWAQLLDPSRNMFVLDDDGSPVVAYVMDVDAYGGPSARLTLNTLESVLDHVYVRTHDFSEGVDDEATAAATLLADVVAPSFGFAVDVTPTGKTADHSYAFEEDRTVGSALNDLMAADGGPEWTIRVTWQNGPGSRLIKTIQIRAQIGNTIPSTVIENKHLEERKVTRSASGDNLATYVIATSDGSGPSRPMSAAYVDADAIAAGVPQWEARVPFTAIDDPDQLDRLAEAGLRRRAGGLTTWEMVLAQSKPGCPRVGRDFDAGDTVQIQSGRMGRFRLEGETFDRYEDPHTWIGMARIIGWRASIEGRRFRTVTPIFWDDREKGTT